MCLFAFAYTRLVTMWIICVKRGNSGDRENGYVGNLETRDQVGEHDIWK